jgi:nitrogen regulatory protein PII
MKLVLIVLNRTDLLEEVIEYFVEVGVKGGTVLDSVGMGKIMAYDIPIFAAFKELMIGSKASNKVLFTTVDNNEIDDFMAGLDKIINFNEPGTGVAFTFNIEEVYGLSSR